MAKCVLVRAKDQCPKIQRVSPKKEVTEDIVFPWGVAIGASVLGYKILSAPKLFIQSCVGCSPYILESGCGFDRLPDCKNHLLGSVRLGHHLCHGGISCGKEKPTTTIPCTPKDFLVKYELGSEGIDCVSLNETKSDPSCEQKDDPTCFKDALDAALGERGELPLCGCDEVRGIVDLTFENDQTFEIVFDSLCTVWFIGVKWGNSCGYYNFDTEQVVCCETGPCGEIAVTKENEQCKITVTSGGQGGGISHVDLGFECLCL